MSGNLGGIGLNPMTAIRAPNDQPDAGIGSVAERHRRAVLRFHSDVLWRSRYRSARARRNTSGGIGKLVWA